MTPGTAVGEYRAERCLGSGGVADVWLLRHEPTGDLAALKLLREADRGSWAERLRVEGRLLSSVRHPNLVQVHAVLETDDGPALLMEYVVGPTLADLLHAAPPLTTPDLDLLAVGAIAGVAAAHARAWVHRDLKPQNVLLALPDLQPKVADFGLAKVLAAGPAGATTRAGAGTRRYMSLEQALGQDADPRMDVFALGAVLYEVAEGRPLFTSVQDWGARIHTLALPPLARLEPRMDRAIRSALAPFADRPRDAGELLAAWGAPAIERPSEGLLQAVGRAWGAASEPTEPSTR